MTSKLFVFLSVSLKLSSVNIIKLSDPGNFPKSSVFGFSAAASGFDKNFAKSSAYKTHF